MSSNKESSSDSTSKRELHRLELHLSDLAAAWRGTYGNPVRQAEIVEEYHATIQQLEALGWNGMIDWDSELPNELMPSNYQYEQQQTNWKMPTPPRSFWQRLWDRLVGPPKG